MKLVGLISGGKDSIFNMLQCIAAGHDIIAVANIEPAEKVELDSYMYQSVGHEALTLLAEALSLPIYRCKTKGKAFCLDKTYMQTPLDEVEDLYELLRTVKKERPIDGVSVGAIASDYQRTRVENVCQRLKLKCFAYLWKRDQAELLQEMIDAQLDAIIIKVASIGLDPNIHLGKHISEIKDNLMELNRKFGVNVCGEGGEYETFTLDCPLFQRVINITQYENVVQSNDAFAPVGFLSIKNAELKEKHSNNGSVKSLQARISHIQSIVRDPYYYVKDCVDTVNSHQNFPETGEVESSEKEIPSASKEKKETGRTISEDGKKMESRQRSLTSQKFVFDPSAVTDTTSSHLNFSTGWCCIGNIAASNYSDAFFLLKKHLEKNSYEFENIVFVCIFVRHMSEFDTLNKIYSQFMPGISPPSRVCVATDLPPNIEIVMLVMAHKLVSKNQKALHGACVVEKEVIHVQSISHWAPANIGPYSQCVKIGQIYYLAGQIPLIPGTMEIFNESIYHQCLLTLRHVIRVLQASNEQLSYSNILQAVCYVTSEAITHDIKSFWTSITKNESSTVTVVVVTELPRNASFEWEVLACGFSNPHVDEVTETTDDFVLHMKRCVYAEPFALSFFCNVSFAKKVNKDEKNLKIITENTIQTVINHCLQFAGKNVKAFKTSLGTLKLFYKSNEPVIGSVIRDSVRICLDSKVVMTVIPVIACENSDIIFTITGVSH